MAIFRNGIPIPKLWKNSSELFLFSQIIIIYHHPPHLYLRRIKNEFGLNTLDFLIIERVKNIGVPEK